MQRAQVVVVMGHGLAVAAHLAGLLGDQAGRHGTTHGLVRDVLGLEVGALLLQVQVVDLAHDRHR